MLYFKWVWFGWSTCTVCWCGTMRLLKFLGGDIKQLKIPAFATEQRHSKQLWNTPINLNILVALQVPLAYRKSPCKSSNGFSVCINNALQRGGTWVWWWFHIAIHIYIISHISTHADNIHEFCSNWCSRSRIVKFGCAPSAVRASCSWSLTCAWVLVCICLFVCAFLVDFCDATEVIGCATPTKNPL